MCRFICAKLWGLQRNVFTLPWAVKQTKCVCKGGAPRRRLILEMFYEVSRMDETCQTQYLHLSSENFQHLPLNKTHFELEHAIGILKNKEHSKTLQYFALMATRFHLKCEHANRHPWIWNLESSVNYTLDHFTSNPTRPTPHLRTTPSYLPTCEISWFGLNK